MNDNDNASNSSSTNERRRGGRHHRSSNFNSLPGLPGGRGHRHRHQESETRGTFRFRNPDEVEEFQPQNGYPEDSRPERQHHHRGHRHGYYSLTEDSQSSSGGRRHRRHHRHTREGELEEDPIEKEKQLHKLSLLDGIEELLKKTGPEKSEGATAAASRSNYEQENVPNDKVKKLEDESFNSYDGASNRPYKSYGGRGGQRHEQGSYRSHQDANNTPDDDSFDRRKREYHNSRNFSSYNSEKPHRNRHHGKYAEPDQDGVHSSQNYKGRRGHRYEKRDDRANLLDGNAGDTESEHYKNLHKIKNSTGRSKVYPSAPKAKVAIDEDATQRERLTEQLESRDFECMVCCETVRHRDPIWNCVKCFNIFHLGCIGKWARTPTAIVEGAGWRCPTCQDIYETIPNQYYCFCGKVRDPELSRHDTPHSCGNVCNRSRHEIKNCKHPCNILCHPGPCPPCAAVITRKCECGKIEMQVKCGRAKSLTCDGVCDKLLNCGSHRCRKPCHTDSCNSCTNVVPQKCYCSRSTREVPCTLESSKTSKFICNEKCGKKLSCGEHECELYCHDGICEECQLLPSVVKNCWCGKSTVTKLLNGQNRQKCTDPIPNCKENCLKVLKCGPEDSPHLCYSMCHSGSCPSCPLKSVVNCRCGNLVESVACAELSTSEPLMCQRRCNKKKHCGRHKCLNLCCVDMEHICELVCNRMLSCGTHRCPDLCHRGNCKACSNVSFEDLHCDCGTQMAMAPVACGAKPPECYQPCSREHACDHPIQHNCHSDENCAPCTAFTEKLCFGGHEKRSHVPCFLESLSCGRNCGKPISCGQHLCQKTCHEGVCEPENGLAQVCNQPCMKKRVDCEHPCLSPCHKGPCPLDNPCKTMIQLTCMCGTRSDKVPCVDNVRLFKQVSASLLASKMQDIQLGNSVDISDVLGGSSSKKNKLGKLDCNDECSTVERNRRLALALQIRNPDLSNNPGPPKYSDFLKDEYRKNGFIVKNIFEKFGELVQLAKQSKQKSRSHSFQPMNRDHRRVVHELAEFFGCETESFDQEPKRNVVITAFRDRSFLPSNSIMAVVEREMGFRKAPPPLVGGANSVPKPTETLSLEKATTEKVIDYFDF